MACNTKHSMCAATFVFISSPGPWVIEHVLILKARGYSSSASTVTFLKDKSSLSSSSSQSLFRFLYYSYCCSNQGSRFTGTINWKTDRDSHGACISYVPPCLGWTDRILPEVRAIFLAFVQPFPVQLFFSLLSDLFQCKVIQIYTHHPVGAVLMRKAHTE